MSESEDVAIQISRELYERLQRKILGTSFVSVEQYVTALIEQTIGDESIEAEKRGLTPKEEEEMKEKLKTLGYL